MLIEYLRVAEFALTCVAIWMMSKNYPLSGLIIACCVLALVIVSRTIQ